MKPITKSQLRFYEEIKAAGDQGKRYNGNARKPLEALVRRGLVHVNVESYPVAGLGRGPKSIGTRYHCRIKAPLPSDVAGYMPPGPSLAQILSRVDGRIQLAEAELARARGTLSKQVATVGTDANARLIAAAPELLAALTILATWRMRDGTPCFCPAGKDEWEPRGQMPTVHATACEQARAALAKAIG